MKRRLKSRTKKMIKSFRKYQFYLISIALVFLFLFLSVLTNIEPKKAEDNGVYSLNVSCQNCTITKTPDKALYDQDEKVIIEATPSDGHLFVKWNQDYRSMANPAIIKMTKNKTIVGETKTGTITPNNYVLERVENANSSDLPPTTEQHQIFPLPSFNNINKGESVVDEITGTKMTKISHVTDFPAAGLSDTVPPPEPGYSSYQQGFMNGYSKYTNVNVTGEYAIAFTTNNIAALYRLSDNTLMQVSVPGETSEPRWDLSGDPGTEYDIYYRDYFKIYRKDLITNESEQIIDFQTHPSFSADFPFTIRHEGHSSQSNDGVYRVIRIEDTASGKIVIINQKAKQVAAVIDGAAADLDDISPSGEWLMINNKYEYVDGKSQYEAPYGHRFYKITDLINGNYNYKLIPGLFGAPDVSSPGHDGWSRDAEGNEVYLFQSNQTDGIAAYNFVEDRRIDIFHSKEAGFRLPEASNNDCLYNNYEKCNMGPVFGQHMARIDNPLLNGWFLLATYNVPRDPNNLVNWSGLPVWADNQIMLVEIKPATEHPRIFRVSMNHNIFSNKESKIYTSTDYEEIKHEKEQSYYAEGFANIDFSGNNIYIGSNWMNQDNLELYRMELPQNWYKELTGTTLSLSQSYSTYKDLALAISPAASNLPENPSYKWTTTGDLSINPSDTSKDIQVTSGTVTGNSESGPGFGLNLDLLSNGSVAKSRSTTVYIHKLADIDGKRNNDGSFDVDFDDFVLLLSSWGTPINPMANINRSGTSVTKVDFDDFVALLSNWGR